MKTLKQLTVMAGTVVLVALATGCSTDNAITGPETEPPPPETNYYDVSFRVHRFFVNGDCDGGILGKGDFSYGIQVLRETAPGSGAYTHVKFVDSKGYPKSSGTKYKRSDDQNLNINESVFVGRLEEGCNYKLIASVIEWDGVLGNKKDNRMSGSPRTEVNSAGGKSHYQHKMTLGSSGSCQLFLYFDADETLVK